MTSSKGKSEIFFSEDHSLEDKIEGSKPRTAKFYKPKHMLVMMPNQGKSKKINPNEVTL